MERLDLRSIDLPTLSLLAGVAANETLLERIRAAGHHALRNAHGYLFQHLLIGPKSVGELAALLGVTQQAVSKTALELEQLGYVERHIDTSDARVRRVALTAAGRAVVAQARAERAKLEAELVEAVGSRAVAAARRALIAMLEITGGTDAVVQRRVKPPSV